MSDSECHLPVLAFLQRRLEGETHPPAPANVRYPTPISQLLGFEVTEIGPGTATVKADVQPAVHGNQQGTVHGGFLVELADAAIGTAHSTLMQADESFTSIDIRAAFLRPVWQDTLRAVARPTHSGRTISHYGCDIVRSDGKTVATVTSTVMTLRGQLAVGR